MQMELLLPHRQVLPVTAFHVEDLLLSPNAAMTLMTTDRSALHLNTRSIIFPEEDVITVELGEGRRQVQEQGLASFDGDTEIPIVTGDRIVIQKVQPV